MIPWNFDYCRPDTIDEAVGVFTDETRAGKKAYYYGGGTEIITLSRVSDLSPGVVIDIKQIPECNALETGGTTLTLGAALTLTQVAESNVYPLLGLTCGRIADHTVQDKITLGGNVAGTIIYRESVLPLLLADAAVTVAGPEGLADKPLMAAFDQKMRLNEGEFIVRFILDAACTKLPYWHVKKTSAEKIGYPLLTVCALQAKEGLRIAFSGVCAYPFRSPDIERVLSHTQVPPEAMAESCIQKLPAAIHNDVTGAADYRAFELRETLKNLLRKCGMNGC